MFKQIILKYEINRGYKYTDILIIKEKNRTQNDVKKETLASHFLLPVIDQHSTLEPVLPSQKGEPRNELHRVFIASYIS